MHQLRIKVIINRLAFVRNWSVSSISFKVLNENLLDYNEKLRREDILKPTVGNESLHEINTGNGIGVVNFATSGRQFSHSNIHKYIWTSYGKT
jgi:hypothetical protein